VTKIETEIETETGEGRAVANAENRRPPIAENDRAVPLTEEDHGRPAREGDRVAAIEVGGTEVVEVAVEKENAAADPAAAKGGGAAATGNAAAGLEAATENANGAVAVTANGKAPAAETRKETNKKNQKKLPPPKRPRRPRPMNHLPAS